MITIKRIYEPYSKDDGYRVLVDRLWPRGISKVKAHIDLWLKEIAPSDYLRKWFHHDPEKWEEFGNYYRIELMSKKDLIEELEKLEKVHKKITLLYGATDELHNQAIVLKQVL